MKNYSLNEIESKSFILNYVVLNDRIIINYATGEVETFPYTLQNEKSILNKMKRQVVNSKRFSGNLNNIFETFFKLFIDEVLLFILFIITMINMKFSLIPTIIGSIIFPTVIGLTGYKLNKYQKLRNDIKKNLLFLNNEECLNLAIRDNPEVAKGLDDKLRDKVYRKEGNNFSFTFNTIDRMEYKELQEVYSYVDKIINNKPNTLERKKNRRKR